jgi:hypothetical protein
MAFVGNACRLPEGATAGDIPRGLRANGGLGPARLVERRGRLWRRSGSHRPTGELGGGGVGGVGGVEGVGLIQLVAEHKGLGRRTRRRQGWWGGGDAEVIQYFGHNARRRDQGQQDHLGLASGAFEPGDTEASHQQAGPKVSLRGRTAGGSDSASSMAPGSSAESRSVAAPLSTESSAAPGSPRGRSICSPGCVSSSSWGLAVAQRCALGSVSSSRELSAVASGGKGSRGRKRLRFAREAGIDGLEFG